MQTEFLQHTINCLEMTHKTASTDYKNSAPSTIAVSMAVLLTDDALLIWSN